MENNINNNRNHKSFIKIKEIRDKINELYSLLDNNELSGEDTVRLKQKIDYMHVEKDLVLYKLNKKVQS